MSSGPKVNPFLASIPAVSNEKYLVPKHAVCENLFMFSVKHSIMNNA